MIKKNLKEDMVDWVMSINDHILLEPWVIRIDPWSKKEEKKLLDFLYDIGYSWKNGVDRREVESHYNSKIIFNNPKKMTFDGFDSYSRLNHQEYLDNGHILWEWSKLKTNYGID